MNLVFFFQYFIILMVSCLLISLSVCFGRRRYNLFDDTCIFIRQIILNLSQGDVTKYVSQFEGRNNLAPICQSLKCLPCSFKGITFAFDNGVESYLRISTIKMMLSVWQQIFYMSLANSFGKQAEPLSCYDIHCLWPIPELSEPCWISKTPNRGYT